MAKFSHTNTIPFYKTTLYLFSILIRVFNFAKAQLLLEDRTNLYESSQQALFSFLIMSRPARGRVWEDSASKDF